MSRKKNLSNPQDNQDQTRDGASLQPPQSQTHDGEGLPIPQDQTLQTSEPSDEIDPDENLREFHRIYEGIVEESRRQAMNWMIMLEREFGDPYGPNFDDSPKPCPPRPTLESKK